jgi:hypothetical protein
MPLKRRGGGYTTNGGSPLSDLNRLIALSICCLLLQACAAHPKPDTSKPSVAYSPVALPGTVRYQLSQQQVATGAKPAAADVVPIYPASLVEKKLDPKSFIVKLLIDENGQVYEVRAMEPAQVVDPDDQLFIDAIRGAVTAWHFSPLRISEWKDGPDGNAQRVSEKTVPFSSDYSFRFEIADNRPVVSAVRNESTEGK